MNTPPAGGIPTSPMLLVQLEFFISTLPCLDEGSPGDVNPMVARLPVVGVAPTLAAAEKANVLLDVLHATERILWK